MIVALSGVPEESLLESAVGVSNGLPEDAEASIGASPTNAK